ICTNLIVIIGLQLRGTHCRIRSKDATVRSGPAPQPHRYTKGLFSYPDLVVACGEPKYLDAHQDVLLNPKVIIEVLSPSTRAFDWGEKFIRYRTWLPSLTDYIVVAQDQPLIEHYAKQENGLWYIAATVTEISGSFIISSINCTITLTDVYDRVTFPPPEEDQEEERENNQ
ncbi:MAG TPA: Uma2 family endonuclease, partial [Blastocatellia bacterium]|nr:Uma2 family endonuclease [Blastocatellia bacterium]